MRITFDSQSRNVDEGDRKGRVRFEERAADTRQKAVGAEELWRFGEIKGEGGPVVGYGARNSRREVRELEKAQAGPANAIRTTGDQRIDRGDPDIRPDCLERVGEQLLTRLADEVCQPGPGPALCRRTFRTRSSTERQTDATVTVKLDKGIGGREGHAKKTGLRVHTPTVTGWK